METLTIELTNPKARKLIDDLVELGIISLKSVPPTVTANRIDDAEWLAGIGGSPSFDFLHDEAENIYLPTDGTWLIDEK